MRLLFSWLVLLGKLSKFRTRQLDAAGFDWGSATAAIAATNDARSRTGATNAAVAAVANSALVGQTKSGGSKKTKKKGKNVNNVAVVSSLALLLCHGLIIL